MRYKPNQYDRTACDGLRNATAGGGCPSTCKGLGLAGDACPLVLSHSKSSGISRMPLAGFGFNPTIVRAPAHLRRRGTEFIGTDRFERNNKRVACRNPNLHAYIRNNASTARLLLLDRNLCVLQRSRIRGDRCMAHRYSAVDARLLVSGAQLYASYANMWGDAECRGHFLARLRLKLDAPPLGQFASARRLRSIRNGGVVVQGTRIAMELADVAPLTEVVDAVTGALTRRSVPRHFSTFMHNSMHPLWVPELSAFLGAGHRHLRQGYDANGAGVRGAPFQYGSSYRHVLFTFNATTRRIARFSNEFCIAALDGTPACEGISFIMGAFRRMDAPGTISFSYGVNDCESALLTLSIARLDALLAFGS